MINALHWLVHKISRGRWLRHSLSGGWCPVCGAVYFYERGGWRGR